MGTLGLPRDFDYEDVSGRGSYCDSDWSEKVMSAAGRHGRARSVLFNWALNFSTTSDLPASEALAVISLSQEEASSQRPSSARARATTMPWFIRPVAL